MYYRYTTLRISDFPGHKIVRKLATRVTGMKLDADLDEMHHAGKSSSKSGMWQRTWSALTMGATDGWALEWTSFAISVILLIGLIGLFMSIEGQAVSSWSAELSPTTIIAIISKMVQITLMLPVTAAISQLGWLRYSRPRALLDLQKFDAASRGLLGTLRLLVSLPSLLAAFLTLLTILCLSIEVAAQQCLSTVPTLYLAQLTDIQNLAQFLSTDGLVSQGLIAAAIDCTSNYYGNDDSYTTPHDKVKQILPSSLAYTCADANCAVPGPYLTLSLCSDCIDISKELVSVPTGCDLVFYNSSGTNALNRDCVLHAQNGAQLDMAQDEISLFHTDTSNSWNISTPPKVVLANFTMIEQFFPYNVTSRDLHTEQRMQPARYAAQMCSVSLCTRKNEVFRNTDSSNPGALGERSFSDGIYTAAYVDKADGSQPYYINTSNLVRMEEAAEQMVPAFDFSIDQDSAVFLRQYLASIFNGSTAIPEPSQSDSIQKTQLVGQVALQTLGAAFLNNIAYVFSNYVYVDRDDILQQVSLVIEDITVSMANYLRDVSPSGLHSAVNVENMNYLEERGLQQNSYAIQFGWLAIPIVAELLALSLLIYTIVLTRKHNVPVWKSSVLAIMYHGPRQKDHELYQSQSMLENNAKHREAVMMNTDYFRLID